MPTLIGCFVVKEQFAENLCLSSEDRNYGLVFMACQMTFFSPGFNLNDHSSMFLTDTNRHRLQTHHVPPFWLAPWTF
jgi:hypothetical protein